MKNELDNSNKNVAIKTPQELIHIRHNINLRQYKYWLLMLKVYKDGYEGNGVGKEEISITELINWIGYKVNRKELENDLIELRKETVAFNLLGKDGNKPIFRVDGYINNASIQDGMIKFSLGDWLKDSITNLVDYGSIFNLLNWSIFNHFTGKYEAILYKLCRDYAKIGMTKEMSIAEYRNYMGLKTTEYQEFKDLNKYIISGPVKKINESEASDIEIEAKFNKQGRSVVSVQFLVKIKGPRSISAVMEDNIFLIAKIPVSKQKQQKYLSLMSPSEIELCLTRANAYIEKQEKLGKPVKNILALYDKAINENWGIEFKEQGEFDLNAIKSRTEKEAEEMRNAQLKAMVSQKTKDIAQAEDDSIWTSFQLMEKEEQDLFVNDHFRDNQILLQEYRGKNLASQIVKRSVIALLKRMKMEGK